MNSINIYRVAVASILVALCVATNYALLFAPNMKLMDMIVFSSGFVFGAWTGATVGAFSWLVYGVINPLGFSLPTLLITMIGEIIYGLAGAVLRRGWFEIKSSEWKAGASIKNFGFALVGLVTTLGYDLLTNAVTGLLFYNSILVGLMTMNFPLPMGLIHETFNFLLFFFLCPLTIVTMKRSSSSFRKK